MSLHLLALNGPHKGEAFSLPAKGAILIGRGEVCDIQLMDESMSRSHCRIVINRGQAILKDENSGWGTRVNGRKIDRKSLEPNDVLTLGETQLRFEVSMDPAAPTMEPPVSRAPEGRTKSRSRKAPSVQEGPSHESLAKKAKSLRHARTPKVHRAPMKAAPNGGAFPSKKFHPWLVALGLFVGVGFAFWALLVAGGFFNSPSNNLDQNPIVANEKSEVQSKDKPNQELIDEAPVKSNGKPPSVGKTPGVAISPPQKIASKPNPPFSPGKKSSRPPSIQVPLVSNGENSPSGNSETSVPADSNLPKNPSLMRARQLRQSGKFQEAVLEYRSLLKVAEAKLAPEERRLSLQRQLAEVHRATGQYHEAEQLYGKCHQASEPKITSKTKDIPQDLLALASTQSSSGNDSLALKTLNAGLKSRTTRFGNSHLAVADVHFAIGRLHTTRQEWLEGINHLQSCLSIRRARDGKESESLIRPLFLIGKCYLKAHQANRAEPHFLKALGLSKEHYLANDPRVAEAEARLGRFYADTGRPKEAGRLLMAGESRISRVPSDKSASTIYVRNQVAEVMSLQSRFKEAQQLGIKTLAMARQTFGPGDYRLCRLLNTLAFANLKLGKTKEASELYDQKIQLTIKRFGKDAWQSASAYAALAISDYTQRKDQEAERNYLRAVELFESCPMGPPSTAYATYQNLASFYLGQQRWDEGAKWFGKSAKSSRGDLYAHVPVLPDETKFVYASVVMSTLERQFSDAVLLRSNPTFSTASAEWLVNLKGFVVEVLSQRSNLSRNDNDPAVRKLLLELTRIRQRLAAASVSLTQRPGAKQIELLRQQERDISAQLGAETRSDLKSDSWISIDTLRGLLEKDEVVIEFLKFRFNPLKPNFKPADYYVAWVVPPLGKGEIQLEILGPAKPIDETITEYHKTLEDSWLTLSLGKEAAAVQRLAQPTAQLSQLLIERLPKIKEFSSWKISPDGALWLVPWAALITDGKYAVENHEISYLVTSRQLTWKRHSSSSQSPSVIVANPDYDAGVPPRLAGAVFSELPGTAKEAQVVSPSLAKYSGGKPLVVQGNQATEKRVKTMVSPKVMMFCTHGYFDELEAEASGNAVNRHPLMRCGLAMTSANGSLISNRTDGDDGVLTGLEVTGLDLRGTELVVLSACQTALGEAHRGEGVSGLRQAFQLAGAKSVVATLWSIPDAESVDVTQKMFQELASGKRDSKALQLAQQSIIEKRRKDNGAAHPLFWAAFCVTRTGK